MEQDTLESPHRRRPVPRLYHKKSRLGCLRCKGRRVKCDERRPVCSGCARYDVECVYPSGEGSNGVQERGDSGSDRALERPKRKRTAEPQPSGYTLDESRDGTENGDVEIAGMDLFPESRDRRMTELRLLHQYLLTHSRTFDQRLGTPPPNGYVWSADLVRRALAGDGVENSDGILYALLAHAALSVWMGTDPAASAASKQHHCHLHQQYLSMALRAQRRAVDRLVEASQTAESSTDKQLLADNVGSAALLLVNHSFALVQTLPVDPWQPPHEWLHMGRGAMQVMQVAKEFLGLAELRPSTMSTTSTMSTMSTTPTTPTSISRATATRALPPSSPSAASSTHAGPKSLVLHIVQSPPQFDPADMFAPVWAAPYLHLLDEPELPIAESEPEIDERHHYPAQTVPGLYNPDRATHSASAQSIKVYYETLAYIGWCAAAVQRADEPLNGICRRMAAAAYWFPEEFEARLDERRPRALVCLAQFFALWIPFEFSPETSETSTSEPSSTPVWMMGTAGRRQVAAIHDALPTRWKSKVAPLLELKSRS